MIIATLLFNRPDLLQMQVECVRRFSGHVHRHVVGIHAQPKVEADARRRLGDAVEWIKVDGGQMGSRDALSEFLGALPRSDTTMFLEQDVFPFRNFTVDPVGDDFTCRAWYGRQHQAWAVWRNGCAPSFAGKADHLIPSIPIKSERDLPKELAGLGYHFHPLSGGEIIASDFWHYERAGMGPMPRHVVEGKDGFVRRFAESLGIDIGDCWAQVQREASPDDLERHGIAVEAARLNPPKPVDLTCAHRSKRFELVECDTGCRKGTKIKVFDCAVFGSAQLGRELRTKKSCAGCVDRIETSTQGSP